MFYKIRTIRGKDLLLILIFAVKCLSADIRTGSYLSSDSRIRSLINKLIVRTEKRV